MRQGDMDKLKRSGPYGPSAIRNSQLAITRRDGSRARNTLPGWCLEPGAWYLLREDLGAVGGDCHGVFEVG